VEQGESQISALERELVEELQLSCSDIRIGCAVAESTYGGGADGPALHLVALEVELLPEATLPGEVPGESEWIVTGLPAHDDLAWVEPTCLLEYRVPPADVPISELLVRKARGN
jgi:8-oxo-dGTP pyrophosphatase MutT (NUDIX family)